MEEGKKKEERRKRKSGGRGKERKLFVGGEERGDGMRELCGEKEKEKV